MLLEIPPEQFAACLDATADDVLRSARVAAPPVDAVQVARHLGLMVAMDERQEVRARCVRLRDGPTSRRPTILVRREPRAERGHWSVAHEIGEHFARRVFAALGADPREAPPGSREQIANLLANRLLLPARWFAAAAEDSGWDLFALKRRFATASHELIARRMLDFPPLSIVTIFDQGRVTFRRSNLPGELPPFSTLESCCRQRAFKTNLPTSAQDASGRAAAWPVHEPPLFREIVRRELAECPELTLE